MGYKQHTACGAVILLILLFITALPVQASSSKELYAFYGMAYESDLPDEVYTTIMNYQSAQRLLKQYRYLQNTYGADTASTVSELRSNLTEITAQLKNGFYLSLADIERLEMEYKEKLAEYNAAVSRSKSHNIDLPVSDDFYVPTTEEYQEALRVKAEYSSRENIGDLSNLTLFSQAYLVDDFDSTSVAYLTADGTPVLSLFNGEVSELTEEYVGVDCYNGIMLYYYGVSESVEIGDTVYQGKVIGYSSGRVTLKLQINGVFVSVHKLLEEGSNEDN